MNTASGHRSDCSESAAGARSWHTVSRTLRHSTSALKAGSTVLSYPKTAPLLQLHSGNERLRRHFFLSRFTFAFDFSACCFFFCRFGILVAGFLAPCRSFLVIVVDLPKPLNLPSAGQARLNENSTSCGKRHAHQEMNPTRRHGAAQADRCGAEAGRRRRSAPRHGLRADHSSHAGRQTGCQTGESLPGENSGWQAGFPGEPQSSHNGCYSEIWNSRLRASSSP